MGIPKNWLPQTNFPVSGRGVVVDIDGVLADLSHRRHFVEEGKKDWLSFFATSDKDLLIEEIALLLKLLSEDLSIILLTGRPVSIQQTTVDWLALHEVKWDGLIMRDVGDYSRALDFKRQTVRRLKALGLELALAFEDDPKNKAMFDEEGVPCVYIHSGYHF